MFSVLKTLISVWPVLHFYRVVCEAPEAALEESVAVQQLICNSVV